MILSDYFLSTPGLQWQLSKQLGVNNAVVRLPEDPEFDMTNPCHIKTVASRFKNAGLRPLVVEPMPNSVHDHIKRGDTLECFHETFHDNGQTDMVRALKCYKDVGFNGPVRIDHVPTMAGEVNDRPGYETIGRLYAIGYLRGLAEAIGYPLH